MGYYSNVLFNSQDLTEIQDVFIEDVSLDAQIDVTLYNGKIARADGIKHYGKSYGARKISVEGHIGANSRETYVTARSALMRFLEEQEAILQVPIKNLPLEFTATVENIAITDAGGGYGRFIITFLCSDPFGYDRDLRTLINGTLVTSASSEVSYTESIGGDYKTPLYLTLVIASVTGATTKYIRLTNTAGNSITITRTWLADDVLVIDMKNLTCKVNGALVDYTGTFWEAGVGDTSLFYTDNMTTRSVGVTATYKRRLL